MDYWIDFARGPLFRVSATIMVLGVVYRIAVSATQAYLAWRGAGDRRLPWADIATATGRWLFPLGLLRQRPIYSLASFVFHVAMIVVPLFLLGHVALLAGYLPAFWPTLNGSAADVLSVVGIVSLLMLFIGRLVVRTARQVSRTQDALVVLALMMTFASGFLAAHPLLSPFGARSMMLVHALLGNLVLILIPTSKISHCIIYPLAQLIFQLGWHFPANTGRHVAVALAKENEPI